MDQQYELWKAADPSRRRARGQDAASGARRRVRPGGRGPAALADLAGKGLVPKPGSPAVKAKTRLIPPDATADEAFRLTLQHCKWHILANLPAVREARDVDGVHQLRVALRRLRVALAAFGKEFRTPPIEALRMRAKILAQGLAPARDMDVFLDELFEPAADANGSVDAFAELRERAYAVRRTAWDDAVREVSGLAFRTFLQDLGEAVDHRLWRGDAGGLSGVYDTPARVTADRMLARRLKMAKAQAKKLATMSEPERHELRIVLKKLRYSVEFFASLYPARRVKPFRARLSQMQDILGLLQDVAVARSTLKQLVEGPPDSLFTARSDLSFAAGTVYGWHLDRASSAWRDAVSCWKKFAKAKPFWA